MLNLFSCTVGADLILMIQSIFLWLSSSPSLLCQGLEHPHPCSGMAGLQEEFLTAACYTIRPTGTPVYAAGIAISQFIEYNACGEILLEGAEILLLSIHSFFSPQTRL